MFCSVLSLSKFGNIAILRLFLKIFSMHIGPRKFALSFFLRFSASSTKSKMAAKILCRSPELEPLYGFVSCFVQRKDPTLHMC